MEKLCCKCKQEECPRCEEKAQERRKCNTIIILGVLSALYVARIGYVIGKAIGQNENSTEEDGSDNEES